MNPRHTDKAMRAQRGCPTWCTSAHNIEEDDHGSDALAVVGDFKIYASQDVELHQGQLVIKPAVVDLTWRGEELLYDLTAGQCGDLVSSPSELTDHGIEQVARPVQVAGQGNHDVPRSDHPDAAAALTTAKLWLEENANRAAVAVGVTFVPNITP